MKKYICIVFIAFLIFEIVISNQFTKESMTLQEKHMFFLENSPFKQSKSLSEKERKALGVPPNKYYEDEWELTMNPNIGKPTPENLIDIQNDIMAGKYDMISSNKSVPGDLNNFWIERGPNNVGGRTKALLFDPNDPTNETVFAGGVSGGLWKNTNISNSNSQWTLINDLSNVSVSSITVDPLNSNIFYLGTGESYTNGDGVGNGVWKSTDKGTTWAKIFGGFDGAIEFQSNAVVTVNSPSSIIGDYAAIQAGFGPELTSLSGDLVWVNDGSPNPTLGCTDLINASSVFGKIAVIQRGTCLFVDKVRFAQNAGAKAVLMINNVSGAPFIMGGTNFDDIVIPSVMISQADGLKISNAMVGNNVNVTFNPRQSLASGVFLIPGKSQINDIIAVNNNGSTEIYTAVGDSYYGKTSSPLTFFGSGDVGVYKSVDNGNSWTRMYLPPTLSGNFYVPQDLEYSSNNTLWVSTTNTDVNNDGGGTILSSTDHVNFIPKYSFSNGERTEIAISKTNPNVLYAVSHLSNYDINNTRIAPFVGIVKTNDGFTSTIDLSLPIDNYTGIPNDDFTNSQSWFDLAIEVSPNNDQTVYVGGINWHKSTNGGSLWSQFSNSYGGGLPNIHPDQHGLVFATPSIFIIGNDGGVAYSNNGGSSISHRINNYNVTQFYHLAVAPTSYAVGEYFVAGSQDNGTQLFKNAIAGIAPSEETQGGDGAYCFFDQDGTDKYFISNYIYNQNIRLTKSNGSTYTINTEDLENGDFICQQGLDSKLNILYTNYSSGTNNYIRRYSITNLTTVSVTKTLLTNATYLTSSPTSFKVSPYTTTSTTLIVGLKNGKILKLTNANTTTPIWSDISSSEIVGSISDIEFGSTEQELFVTIHNYGVKSIWYSSNGGVSWVNKEGNLPDMPVKCILRNPLRTEQVLIGTELGTWWTQNFSAVSPTWYYGSNGMNSVKVTSLEMRNDYKVYASTYGRGIFSGQFTSTDGTVGIDDFVTNTLTVYPNPANEFINFNSKIELKKPQIQVFDLNNKLVAKYSSNIDGKSYKINVSTLNTGIYILKVTSDYQTFSSKIIKK